MKIILSSSAVEHLHHSALSAIYHAEWEKLDSRALEQFDAAGPAEPIGVLVLSSNGRVQKHLADALAGISAEENATVETVPVFATPVRPASRSNASSIASDLNLLVLSDDEKVAGKVNDLVAEVAADFAAYGKTLWISQRKEAAGDIDEAGWVVEKAVLAPHGHVFEISSDWIPQSLVDFTFKKISDEFGMRLVVFTHWTPEHRTLVIMVYGRSNI